MTVCAIICLAVSIVWLMFREPKEPTYEDGYNAALKAMLDGANPVQSYVQADGINKNSFDYGWMDACAYVMTQEEKDSILI